MRRFVSSAGAALLLLAGGLPGPAAAQASKEIVGAWTLVSLTVERDGRTVDFYGPNPLGQTIFDPNGRFSSIFIRSDLPTFASNNREAGTPEENRAVVQGSIAFFGAYSVGPGNILNLHIEGSTFPNWRGVDQRRPFELAGDELRITNPTASTGTGGTKQVWRRAK